MLFNILIFILVLSWLVFFHELGHFLAAKACGIYCDRFSLGMPPRIFGMRIGETDYCIGALPIGGYVKMAGQEDVPLSDEEREKEFGDVPPERWFSTKPIWQRVIVIAAGPVANLILAVFMYGVVVAFEHEVPEWEVDSRVGQIQDGSPVLEASLYQVVNDSAQVDREQAADETGWKTGDRILRVNGNPIKNILPDVAAEAALGGGQELAVLIERTAPDGTATLYKTFVSPKIMGEGERLARIGIAPFFGILVEDVIEDSPAAAAGITSGDEILRADGDPVDMSTFILTLAEFEDGQPVELEVGSSAGVRTVTVNTRAMGRFPDYLIYIPEDPDKEDESRPLIAGLSDDQREVTGLKPKDIITEINGQPATYSMLKKLEHDKPGETLQVSVLRPAIWYGLLRSESTFDAELTLDRVGSIGVAMSEKTVLARAEPGQIVPEAFERSKKALLLTTKTLSRLVTGYVSPRDLGGPVMIGQIASQAARRGLPWLMEMTAFISINLAIFNLLPLPVLDGGHLLFLGIESVRRKPLSSRVMEWVQQAGLVFILMLMLFVTFNDVHRWISSIIP